MNRFTIEANNFLTQEVKAFYHTNFYGVSHPDNPNFLYKLKNDHHHNWNEAQLNYAKEELTKILKIDLPQILNTLQLNQLTICVVPRAKAENTYRSNQLLFKSTIKSVINKMAGFNDGISYINRHTNTKTTHLRQPVDGFNNDGSMPYQGITNDTCSISNDVVGKDILLIDDIYTKTVNIDEDIIQALLTKGARSVAFYAIGNTVSKFMKYTENSLNILTTKTFKGIGRAWIVKYLKGNESIKEIVSLLNNYSKQEPLITIDDFEFSKNQILNQINKLQDFCDGLTAIGDKDFPRYRGDVKESERPIFLFYKGDINLLDINNINITVIGLLNPDESIELREQKIVSEIIKRDITIVSGLAFGCDSIAHKQALKGGRTVAILPSPLNSIMPSKNKGLAFEIVEQGGLLVTEYYEIHKSSMELSSRYKERDRLQALFCDAIILAASYAQDSASRWNIINQKLDSGARLAMGYAKEYNIPRAIMYDANADINNPMFDLNRELLTKQKDVTVLTKNSLETIINKLESDKLINNRYSTFQPNLFS